MQLQRRMLNLGREIQKRFPSFVLGGGTAIMFRYNHRESIDLDFFFNEDISFTSIIRKIQKNFDIEGLNQQPGADNLDIFIDKIKVSFILFPFKAINNTEDVGGIITFSDYDLFLNKIYACGRRIIWKDPYDMAFLWEKFNYDLNMARRNFKEKFFGQDFDLYLKAATSVEDYPELQDKPEIIQTLSQMAKTAKEYGFQQEKFIRSLLK